MELTVISFGYGHGPAPADCDITLDVRRRFRDPHIDPAMRNKTGRNKAVREKVWSTPGVPHLIDQVADAIWMLTELTKPDVRVAIGCVGGRHRSFVMAEMLANKVRQVAPWLNVAVEHRDVDKPVIERQTR